MTRWDDARRGAMNAEEAALLPALPRGGLSGSVVFRDMIHAAQAISEKQVSNEVNIALGNIREEKEQTRPLSRAALHHVLRK